MDSLLGRILKLIFGSIVVGLFSGLIIPRVINAFSSDGSFELSELLLTFLIIHFSFPCTISYPSSQSNYCYKATH